METPTFKGDSFLFEYYMTIGSISLFDQYALAKVIWNDIHEILVRSTSTVLSVVNCSAYFFPTGLPMYVMGRMLWNNEDWVAIFDDYFSASFGDDRAITKETVKVIGEEINRTARFEETIVPESNALSHLTKLEQLCADFKKVVERNSCAQDTCRAWSWYYLRWYLDILEHTNRLLRSIITRRSPEEIVAAWNEC